MINTMYGKLNKEVEVATYDGIANEFAEVVIDNKNMTIETILNRDEILHTYVYYQESPQCDWRVTHNLGRYPSVVTVDDSKTEIVGEIKYLNKDQILIHFNGAYTGYIYLN